MIEFVRNFNDEPNGDEKDIVVEQVFDGPFRRLVEVRLQNGAVLSRHKADVPITVFCLSGNGRFSAGHELEESTVLTTGALITLDAGIEHEVAAEPKLRILVSKFKDS